MADKNSSDPIGASGTAPKQGPKNTNQFHPTNGGYDGASIEAGGEAGDKGVSVESEYSKSTEEGNYCSAAPTIGDYPHSGPNPDNLEGPPLASTSGGPNNSNY